MIYSCPEVGMEILQSPTPLVIGIRKNYKRFREKNEVDGKFLKILLNLYKLEDFFVVDLDSDKIIEQFSK